MDLINPNLSKDKKTILKNFGRLTFFLSYYFLVFDKKEIKRSKHTNNQNQEAFIVIITNYTFSVFLLCLLCKIIFVKKY